MNRDLDLIVLDRKTVSLLGSFLQVGGLLVVLTWIVYALPLLSLYTGGTFGIGTFHEADGVLGFAILGKWHLSSAQFDGYMLSVMLSIVFAKFGFWGFILGNRFKDKAETAQALF